MKGVISAGHDLTAEAGLSMLKEGGNAFDAAVAAVFSAFITESALTGIGGGGFFMAHSKEKETVLYDFFPNMPGKEKVAEKNLHFFPVQMDFSDTSQEFHIGRGSAAVPGSIAGLAEIYKKHCTLLLSTLLKPAISYARQGIILNKRQAYFNSILQSILTASGEAKKVYAPQGHILKEGERIYHKDAANTLEYLISNGLESFYEGEFASKIVEAFGEEGLITKEDINSYSVYIRKPLEINYRGRKVYTNPPPSSGGSLIAFALKVLESYDISLMDHNGSQYLHLLFEVMKVTNIARGDDFDHRIYDDDLLSDFLSERTISSYREKLSDTVQSHLTPEVHGSGNTTHISVIDEEGNAASVTTSNGEGCGYMIPGTGVMLNNMLGEEDINPHGFHSQKAGIRLSSMMAPTIVMKNDMPEIVLGSGGSNRIRNAILQLILNVIDHGLPISEAVNSPRCHWGGDIFHAEKGMNEVELSDLSEHNVTIKRWSQKNMYFGGVHCAVMNGNGKTLSGAGDSRRGGICLVNDK